MQTLNKHQILKQLNEQFGIKEIPKEINLIKLGEEKIFGFSGDLEILKKIERMKINIAGVGNYIAKEERGQIRLSIEGTHLFKEQISRNIFELNQEQKNQWMHGSEILLDNIKNTDEKLIADKVSKVCEEDNKQINKLDKDNLVLSKSSRKILTKSDLEQHNFANESEKQIKNKIKLKKGFLIMKYKDDFLGTGKASENKIGNFIPKNRRLKHANR